MIFSSRLTLKSYEDGRIALVLPAIFRLTLLGIGLLILISIIVTGGAGFFVAANTIPIILCAICLLAAAYHDRWIFDKKKDELRNEVGISVLQVRRILKISELEGVELTQFLRGRLPSGSRKDGTGGTDRRSLFHRSLLTLSLMHRNGKIYRLETYNAGQRSLVEKTALQIAEYCGITFRES